VTHSVRVKTALAPRRKGDPITLHRWVRYWACACDRLGPEVENETATDDDVLRGGHRHVTLASKRGRK
jgi:hypothetical protein